MYREEIEEIRLQIHASGGVGDDAEGGLLYDPSGLKADRICDFKS